MSWLLSAW